MNQKLRLCTFCFFIFVCTVKAQKPYLLKKASELFSPKEVITPRPLREPFAMVMGPDDSLWVTERRGYVTKVDPANGDKVQILDVTSNVKFSYSTGNPYSSGSGSSAAATTYTSAAGATSSGKIITVSSTANLVVGMRLSVFAGTGAFAATTEVLSIANSTQFRVTKVPTTALAGGATVIKGNGTIITVSSTTNLKVGMAVTVTAGTGKFATGTTAKKIINGTSFFISETPATALSGATVKAVDIVGISQDGMFGIALHPELNKGTGNDYVYLAYCYDSVGLRRTKIVRYNYNRALDTLTGETTLLKGIWGSNDHNAGRLVIGDFGTTGSPDYKLVYTVGDRGANQFDNACDTIESQYTPTASQMTAGDIHRYNGKILRLNLDGSIPGDNPLFNGVKTHIYSMGHRNPQGLTFEKKPNTTDQLVPSGKLYSSEQGPATDDEVNLIQSGKNYGWPRVAGKRDNGWYRYFKWQASGSCGSYGGECSTQQSTSATTEFTFSDPNYVDPLFDFYKTTPTTCDWLAGYPTIAPSSVIYYPFNNKIPGWENSLLITTLKTSAVFRLKLNATGTAPALTDGIISGTATASTDSVVQYFNDASINRYRDIVIGKDGITFYLLTDSVGGTSGPSYGQPAGVTDKGAIVKFTYTGTVLAIGNAPVRPTNARLNFNIYPNPASDILTVESKRLVAKPLHYQLYDAAGKIVLQGTNTHEKFNIGVGRLSKGVYVLKVLNAYHINVATEKVIIN